MLNKKAQVDDMWDVVTGVVLIIIGVVILTVLTNAHASSVEQSRLESTESNNLQIDLLNLMKLELNDQYTFAKLSSYFPQNYPEIQDNFMNTYVSQGVLNKKLGCEQALFDPINDMFYPVYGNKWYVQGYIEDGDDVTQIFYCTPHDFPIVQSTFVKIPSQDPNQHVVIFFGVTE